MASHRGWTDGGSVRSVFNNRSLRVLVCSGNMGNAAPDLKSLAAWIPHDGACSSVVVDSPRYPIPFSHQVCSVAHDAGGHELVVVGPDDINDSFEEDDVASRKFDLIVVGLQESTFDVSAANTPADDEEAVQDDNNNNNGGILNALPSSLGELPSALVELPTALGKNVAKAGFSTAHTAKRGITAVKTLATSKDHVKYRQKRQNSQEISLANIATLATNALNEFTKDGTQILHSMLADHLPSYQQIVSFQRGEMRLEIFAINDNDDDDDDIQENRDTAQNPTWVKVLCVRAQNTGRGGLANKGGILAQLLVGSTTRLSFMTAHLEAHEGRDKYKARVTTLADILGGTQTDTRFDPSLTSHTMFVLGDLNFRTELNLTENEERDKEEQMELVMSWVNEKNWEKLNEYDELQHALREGDCLVGFQTIPCHFPPTFKVERKAGYSYKANRRPSYTDRILWKTIPSNFGSMPSGFANHGIVRPLVYEPIDEFSTSDHKPIRGAFEVHLNERLRLRPALHKWQSKRGRRHSLGKATRDKSSGGNVHLFVREMKCHISQSNYSRLGSTAVPDPYLCFMSRPKEMIRMDQKNWKSMLKSAFSCAQPQEIMIHNDDTAIARSTLGWPRSKKLWGTNDPDWEDEEVHFTLQTHDQGGHPFDLAGALMFITLMDHGAALEDHLIGSCVLNLQDVFMDTHPLCQKSKNAPVDSQQQRIHLPASNRSLGNEGNRRPLISRSMFASHPRESLTSEVSAVSSYRIDEPLLKNGKEMGRIQCMIEAWWLDDFTARSTTRRFSSPSLLADTSDHAPVGSLSSRRRLHPPRTNVGANGRRRNKGIRFWRKGD